MEDNTSGLSKKERRELKRQRREQNQGSVVGGNNMKSIGIWGSVFAVLIVGIIWLFNTSKPKAEEGVTKSVEIAMTENEWIKGNKDAPITLVEFSDLQCPACKSYQPMIKELLAKRSDVKLVYKHFPLRSIHKNAQVAAQAAEAAGMQGKFFEYHDVLFDRQPDWALLSNPEEKLIAYAKEMGMDEKKFKDDLRSSKVTELINQDYSEGMKLRVNSTPTFYVNGKKITNPANVEEFSKLIDQNK